MRESLIDGLRRIWYERTRLVRPRRRVPSKLISWASKLRGVRAPIHRPSRTCRAVLRTPDTGARTCAAAKRWTRRAVDRARQAVDRTIQALSRTHWAVGRARRAVGWTRRATSTTHRARRAVGWTRRARRAVGRTPGVSMQRRGNVLICSRRRFIHTIAMAM